MPPQKFCGIDTPIDTPDAVQVALDDLRNKEPDPVPVRPPSPSLATATVRLGLVPAAVWRRACRLLRVLRRATLQAAKKAKTHAPNASAAGARGGFSFPQQAAGSMSPEHAGMSPEYAGGAVTLRALPHTRMVWRTDSLVMAMTAEA